MQGFVEKTETPHESCDKQDVIQCDFFLKVIVSSGMELDLFQMILEQLRHFSLVWQALPKDGLDITSLQHILS